TPRRIRRDLGYNFYENNTNTTDPGIGGILRNPGHGARNHLAAAPGAQSRTRHFRHSRSAVVNSDALSRRETPYAALTWSLPIGFSHRGALIMHRADRFCRRRTTPLSRHTGEGRCPRQRWVLAFAGKTRNY